MIAEPQTERINAASREQGSKERSEQGPTTAGFQSVPLPDRTKNPSSPGFRPPGKLYTSENTE